MVSNRLKFVELFCGPAWCMEGSVRTRLYFHWTASVSLRRTECVFQVPTVVLTLYDVLH